jgi:hypothetical protein
VEGRSGGYKRSVLIQDGGWGDSVWVEYDVTEYLRLGGATECVVNESGGFQVVPRAKDREVECNIVAQLLEPKGGATGVAHGRGRRKEMRILEI